MPRVIRARDVDGVLANGGYEPSEWTGADWEPGYRTAQDGRRRVNVLHDGPGEKDRLGLYTAELRAHGYHVVPDQMPGDGRRRLDVTKP